MDKIPVGLLDELERRGAKRALPDREPGWWTMIEIAQEYGAAPNNKDFKDTINKMVTDNILERRQVYDREKCTRCIVYRLIGKETNNDTPI